MPIKLQSPCLNNIPDWNFSALSIQSNSWSRFRQDKDFPHIHLINFFQSFIIIIWDIVPNFRWVHHFADQQAVSENQSNLKVEIPRDTWLSVERISLTAPKKFVVVGGGGGWVVKCKFSVLLWSKPFSLKLKIWTLTKPTKRKILVFSPQSCTDIPHHPKYCWPTWGHILVTSVLVSLIIPILAPDNECSVSGNYSNR